jgi:hypothetical protein
MVVRALGHVGVLSSPAARGAAGLSTAIEAGVPEAVLWMQSGHSQDVAARRYIQLGSPNLPRSYCIAQGRHINSGACCSLQVLRWVAAGSASGRLRRARVLDGPGPGPDQPESGRSSESSDRGRLERGARAGPGRTGPGPGRARTRSGVRLQAGGGSGGASPPRGGRAQPALFPSLGVAALLFVSVVIGAVLFWFRRVGSASTPSRCIVVDERPMGASWRSVVQAMPGFGL